MSEHELKNSVAIYSPEFSVLSPSAADIYILGQYSYARSGAQPRASSALCGGSVQPQNCQ